MGHKLSEGTVIELDREASTAIDPAVLAEVASLSAADFDVVVSDVADPYRLAPWDQVTVDAAVVAMEQATLAELHAGRPNPMLLLEGRPAIEAWQPLTKRAIALHAIYNPHLEHLGAGIDPLEYEAPLFRTDDSAVPLSAVDVLTRQRGPERAQAILATYRAFLAAAVDQPSRLIWQGTKDGQGVRTRAACAMGVAAAHLRRTRSGQDVTIASLACGAAQPVYELVDQLLDGSGGPRVEQIILADADPMALASAHALAGEHGVEDLIDLRCENLVDMERLGARDLRELLPAGGVDLIDLLGIFEYFPEPLAKEMLISARASLRPGGMIVFGNMLHERPEQIFFDKVSLWPPLEQRSLHVLADIVEQAGFDARRQMKILVPREGVYAVVALTAD